MTETGNHSNKIKGYIKDMLKAQRGLRKMGYICQVETFKEEMEYITRLLEILKCHQ